MRNRHFPRLCRSCHLSMVERDERAATQARLDADRWINEGGSLR
jgi:hypothetical protein